MRCEHCKKQVKDNTIFCMHCGRPIKREYAHFSCEIYDDFSFVQKAINLVTGFSPEKSKYKTCTGSKNKFDSEMLKKGFSQKINTLKDAYDNYTQETSENQNTDSRSSDDGGSYYGGDSEGKIYGNDGGRKEFDGVEDLKERAKTIFNKSSNPVNRQKNNVIKIVVIIFFSILFINMIYAVLFGIHESLQDDYDYSYEYTYDYEQNEYISEVLSEFPEYPDIVDSVVNEVDACPLGSKEFIIHYLNMLHLDLEYMYGIGETYYTWEDYEFYFQTFSQMNSEYNPNSQNNEAYEIYRPLMDLYDLQESVLKPVYTDSDAYTQEEIDNIVYEFVPELKSVRMFYLGV